MDRYFVWSSSDGWFQNSPLHSPLLAEVPLLLVLFLVIKCDSLS